MKRAACALAAAMLVLLLTACGSGAREESVQKTGYISILDLTTNTETVVLPDHEDYDALLDGLFDAALDSIALGQEIPEGAVPCRTITYYQTPTKMVVAAEEEYTEILSIEVYEDADGQYVRGHISPDTTGLLQFCFPLPEDLSELVRALESAEV